MKALLILREAECSWTREFFPGLSPYLLKIVNRPLIDYYLDICSLLKIREVRALFDYTDRKLADYLDSGERWGLSLDYNFIREGETFKELAPKNSAFLAGDSLLVMDGYFFPAYDKELLSPAALEGYDGNLYISRGCCPPPPDGISGLELPLALNSPADYFRLNRDVLEVGSRRFFLPGYSSEEGLFIGQNVAIPRTAELESPLSIGNNVQLKIMTRLLPGSIVGDGVIVDSGTTVENSIILDNTYVGSELELKGIIAYRDLLIEPESGVVTPISDRFLVSPIEETIVRRALERAGGFVLALLTIAVQLIPFILLYPLLRLMGSMRWGKRVVLLNKEGATGRFNIFKRERRGVVAAIFYRLSLNRFPYLFKVLSGRLSLVGNRLLVESPENRRLLERLSAYSPGLFNYPDLVRGEPGQEELHENYYNAHSSTLFKLSLFFRALLKGG